MSLADVLPGVNATLNATSAVCLLLGFRAIRAGRRRVHRRFMLGAFGASTLFLVFYLTRFALTGTHRFPVEGGWKVLYLAVLFSHMLLAIALLPMVLRTLWLPLNGRFPEHRRIARFTFPIWVYVSITGVLVWFMLYQLPRWL